MIDNGTVVTWKNTAGTGSVVKRGKIVCHVPVNVDAHEQVVTIVQVDKSKLAKAFSDKSPYARYVVEVVEGDTPKYVAPLAAVIEKQNEVIAELHDMRRKEQELKAKIMESEKNLRLAAIAARHEEIAGTLAGIREQLKTSNISINEAIEYLKSFLTGEESTGSVTGFSITGDGILYAGERKSLNRWTRELGLEYGTTYARLKRGWSVERAFAKSVCPKAA